ncbi:acyl carrier protein [soil metagenome]
MGDIAAEIRDILVFHLGVEEARLTDQARLAEHLGADSLDMVEIVMSCEERFGIDLPIRAARRFTTVGEAVRFIEDEIATAAHPPPPAAARRNGRLRIALR